MTASFELSLRVVLRGLAQLAFADQAKAGFLLLAAIALVSPWAALGASLGCILATCASFALKTYSRSDWLRGLAGFNGAIVGILWSGFPAAGQPRISLLLLALLLCIILEPLLRQALHRPALPALSMPAVLSAIILSLLLAPSGTWLWFSADQPLLGTWGLMLAVILVLLAAATTSRAAAAQAGVLGVCAALFSIVSTGDSVTTAGGFWAMTVALASFALQGVFLRDRPDGALFGLLAAAAAVVFALLWVSSPLIDFAQPLLAPCILGVWMCLPLARIAADHGLAAPDFWPVLRLLIRSRWRAGRIVAISGTGLASDPERADFGQWYRAELRNSGAGQDGQTGAHADQRRFWDFCASYREQLAGRTVRPAESALLTLERAGWLAGRISLTVGFPPATAGCTTIPLYGDPEQLLCRDCHGPQDWPQAPLWRRFDLRCPRCQGRLKPAVALPGEVSTGPAWQQALAALEAADGVLFLGVERASPELDRLLDAVRRLELRAIVIGNSAAPFPLAPEDLSLVGHFDRSLTALARILARLRPLSRKRVTESGVGQADAVT